MYDLFEQIYNHISNIYDIFNFRLINQSCNKIFKREFKKLKVDVCARSTFLNINECFVCYKKVCKECIDTNNAKLKQIIYMHDSLPHKCLIHCNEKYCYLACIKRFFIDLKKNDIYPFYKITNEFIVDNFNVIGCNDFRIETVRKYRNRWYIKIMNGCMERYIRLNSVSSLKDTGMFRWYFKFNL